MNVDELKQALGGPIPIPDDHRVTIRFHGGMGGSTVAVKSVSQGFDWTNGQLVLTPETALTIDEWYRTLKKAVGAKGSHVGRIVKAAEELVGYDPDNVDYHKKVEALRKALDRLKRFQEQGF